MKMPWQKTSRQEVFDFIVRYEAGVRKETGISSVYPSGVFIGRVFNISRERGNKYLRDFREWKRKVQKK